MSSKESSTTSVAALPMPSTVHYWDHAKNLTNPAKADATARARRAALADGTTWLVVFGNKLRLTAYWNGCRHDCLALAKDLSANGLLVQLYNSDNKLVDIESTRF